ncbi:MAG TPA: hypothetical protein VF137_11995 [Candidatus Dormibacteraeota bacterium]
MQWIVVVVAIAVLLIVTLIWGLVRGRSGRLHLNDLSDESRRRSAERWRVIETRFIDEPREALREADQLAVSILSERGAEMHHERVMPRELREARRLSRGGRADGMHRAMQHYQAIVDDACGKDLRLEAERGRPEVA